MLEAINISKNVPDQSRAILTGISLTVSPGKITAVIGPSGGGKSTLIKCLSLLDTPEAGTIGIDDNRITFPSSEPINPPWPEVTVVFQQFFLWPHMTLRQNIMLPIEHLPDADKRINDLIDMFDMAEFIDRYPNETSGGQKQRVALARAIALKPKYILLDEISSALDVEQAARVLTMLSKLRDKNIGILLITHSIGFAKRAAENIVFLADGQVLESGDTGILDNPQHPRFRDFLQAAKLAR